VVPGPKAADEKLSWGRRVTLAGPRVPGSGGYRVLADLRRVRAVLDALEPDRLEVSDRLTLRGLGRWARAVGVPSTVIAHERVDGVLRAFTPLGHRGAQLAADHHNATTAEHFDRVVTTTRFAAQEFVRIGVPTDHVPLGVDLEQFRPGSRPSGGVPLLVLCSRLSREKRPDLAVEALRVMHRAWPARLVVAGSGPLSSSLRRRAQGLPVELVGHLADRSSVAGLLGTADVVLAPGPVETFGLAALEALACGTPIVAASTSAVAELVEGDAGRTADPEPQALATAIVELLAVPELKRRGAARARAESFPWSRTTDTMLALHGLTAPTRSEHVVA
jgi:alpha-1,6-mannosyltransferase